MADVSFFYQSPSNKKIGVKSDINAPCDLDVASVLKKYKGGS